MTSKVSPGSPDCEPPPVQASEEIKAEGGGGASSATSVPAAKAKAAKAMDLGKTIPKANKHLLERLKTWDTDGDNKFSIDEVCCAAQELAEVEEEREEAERNARIFRIVACGLGFLLLLSIIGNFIATSWAISLAKDAAVPKTTGVMLTAESNEPPKPVSTAPLRETAQGLSGLKEASKEELDRLEELQFFHHGAYFRMKVSQLRRYDGRVEVWGWPAGVVVVEDTGEVHFSHSSKPSDEFDACWGENASTDSLVCGVSVDNEPPSDLEVEEPEPQDSSNAPAPSPNASNVSGSGRRLVTIGTDAEGNPLVEEASEEQDSEHLAKARRLSGRRRSSYSSYSSYSSSSYSSRRRSGSFSTSSTSTSRRRSYGSSVGSSGSSVSTSYRRRSSSYASLDGSSRRRAPDYSSSKSRRRRGVKVDIDIEFEADLGPGDSEICSEAGLVLQCEGFQCWCRQATFIEIIIGIIIFVLVCCCSCVFFAVVKK